MRTFIIALLMIILASPLYADKQVTLTDVDNLRIIIEFNVWDSSAAAYQPAVVIVRGNATDGEVQRGVTKILRIGQLGNRLSPSQIYTAVKNNLGQAVANKVKELYLDGIGEDISQ